jgi:hypothetical protein
MQWHMVEISGLTPRDLQTKSEMQVDAFLSKLHQAKVSNRVDIYRRDTSDRKCIYYFPPDAAALLLAAPAPSKAVPCEPPTDLESLRKINFR